MIKTLAKIGVVSLLAVGAFAPAAQSVAASGASQDGRTWAAPKHLGDGRDGKLGGRTS